MISDLIKVLGNDPFYEGHQIFTYLKISTIYKIIPIYAEKDANGQYWRSMQENPKSKIISYLIIDINGEKYSCGNEHELKKIGIIDDDTKPKIGYINQKGSEKIVIDINSRDT